MVWHIGGVGLESRFFLGTAGYPSPAVLQQAIAASGAQVVTVGLKRQLAASTPAKTSPAPLVSAASTAGAARSNSPSSPV